MPATATLLRLTAVALAAAPGAAPARTWTDASGRYTIEADLVAFDDDQVILQRDADGELGSLRLEDLSEADRKYVESDEAGAKSSQLIDAPQVWTLRSGLKAPGRLVDYTRREVTVARRRGRVYVNDRPLESLPKLYQQIVPRIVGNYEENRVDSAVSLERWLVSRRGQPQSYTVDGVVMELADGAEYAVPFFLFSDEDLELLRPGWEAWLAAAGEHDLQEDRSFELQSLAAAFQQDAQQRQQIARLQLMMQAVDAGATSLWEVTLYPAAGTSGAPLWKVVPGRDSRMAAQAALASSPGFTVGPVRRVSR
ncbi:SHD1 domain-containing protein [Botrimarina sp.]|uniref:SHD1 domain-containing protein n=1 Tax=Botrimarina sp. TaxID=2795802 RepID=UPI0032EB5894